MSTEALYLGMRGGGSGVLGKTIESGNWSRLLLIRLETGLRNTALYSPSKAYCYS